MVADSAELAKNEILPAFYTPFSNALGLLAAKYPSKMFEMVVKFDDVLIY